MLHIKGVEKFFGAVQVLKQVDLEAEKGDLLVLLGPSGCGKSTLLNIIAGLEEPTSGDVVVNGEIVTDLEPRDRDIAMVFQSYALYPSMTVSENLRFGMIVRGFPPHEQARAVAEVAKILKLDTMLDRKPAQLSGGQRQRVAIGRALVRDPKLFLFDEPLSNLDAQLRVEMRTELKKLHQRLNATIVYVTHDQVEAMTLATKVVVMWNGVVQQIGMPQQIYDAPANMFVARFIGSPPMNLISGRVEDNGTSIHFRVKGSDKTIALPAGAASHAERPHVFLGFRPETVILADQTIGGSHAILELRVELIEPTGADTLAFFRLGDSEFLARLKPGACEVGDTVSLALPKTKLLIFDGETSNLLG